MLERVLGGEACTTGATLLRGDRRGSHLLKPCLMHHLDNNTAGERDGWPWKLHTHYYKSMQYS
jgi:choline dehydrogenase-like flavoprotein